MKITCQSCQSKYTVSDEKVQGKTVKIKCRKCGATIIVNSSGASNAGAGGDAAPGADGSYMVNVADGDQRTMSLTELIGAYNESVITGDTYIWTDGMADWQPLAQVDAVVAALNGGGVEAAAPIEEQAYAAPQAYEPEPAFPAAAAAPAPFASPEPPRAAARRDPQRRSADLFGGGMAAQTAQDDVATSAPLFSAPAAGGLTGQREENSTLFSLSALTAKAGSAGGGVGGLASGSASRSTATKEDSGLIDLRALADAGASAAPTNLVPDHGGLFPLGMPAVAAPASVRPMAPVEEKKKSPIPIILGSIIAVCAIIATFFIVKGGGDKPVATTAPTAETAAPVATAAASATASAAPSAEPSAVASAEPSATASAATHARGGGNRGGGRGKAPAAGAAKGGGDGPAKPPPAAKSSCGCAPGDLMCAMKCSAK